jgi:hypothetical protein
VPSAGGEALRLRANAPPACTPPVYPNTRVYPNKTGWDNLLGEVVARTATTSRRRAGSST